MCKYFAKTYSEAAVYLLALITFMIVTTNFSIVLSLKVAKVSKATIVRYWWYHKKFHQCTLAFISFADVFFLVYAGSGSGQSVLLIWADPEHRES